MMDYPSTTQALFALIVMIIVLLFILFYCCWGTFTCARPEEPPSPAHEEAGIQQNQPQLPHDGAQARALVIFPFNSMIYVGDGTSRRMYHIPIGEDKPPAYTEIFTATPPPPYTIQSNTNPNEQDSNNVSIIPENPPSSTPELPPPYEDCVSADTTPSPAPSLP